MDIKIYRPAHRSMWKYRYKMTKLQMDYDMTGKQYVGHFDTDTEDGRQTYKRAIRFAHWHGLRVEYGTFGERSRDYRRVFFSNNRPTLGKYYFCSYCGMPVTAKELQVDHLYPVARVRSSLKLQEKLKNMGAESVNDPCNLIPACRRCNKIKSAHMGFWIVAGEIGRHQKLWFVRWGVRFAVLAAVLVLVLHG